MGLDIYTVQVMAMVGHLYLLALAIHGISLVCIIIPQYYCLNNEKQHEEKEVMDDINSMYHCRYPLGLKGEWFTASTLSFILYDVMSPPVMHDEMKGSVAFICKQIFFASILCTGA